MKKSHIATLIVFLICIPLTIWLGTKIPGRSHYITGTLIIIELLVPFFMAFEGRKPQARELVVIAILCAIAIASRPETILIFFMFILLQNVYMCVVIRRMPHREVDVPFFIHIHMIPSIS